MNVNNFDWRQKQRERKRIANQSEIDGRKRDKKRDKKIHCAMRVTLTLLFSKRINEFPWKNSPIHWINWNLMGKKFGAVSKSRNRFHSAEHIVREIDRQKNQRLLIKIEYESSNILIDSKWKLCIANSFKQQNIFFVLTNGTATWLGQIQSIQNKLIFDFFVFIFHRFGVKWMTDAYLLLSYRPYFVRWLWIVCVYVQFLFIYFSLFSLDFQWLKYIRFTRNWSEEIKTYKHLTERVIDSN